MNDPTSVKRRVSSEGCPKFKAGSIGNGSDNPTYAKELTKKQKKRAVTAVFSGGVSSFVLTFEVGNGFTSGRNFLFASVPAICGT